MKVSRRIGPAALGVVWSVSAIAQGHPFSAEQFYRDLEPEVRAHYKDGWDKAKVETQRRAAKGLPHMNESSRGVIDESLKLIIYNTAVRKVLCFEQAMAQGKNKEMTSQIVKKCLDQTVKEFEKFNKITDYANSIPGAKSARCEMKARDYENEIRFPAFDFLRNDKEIAPHLMDFKALSDCLLAD